MSKQTKRCDIESSSVKEFNDLFNKLTVSQQREIIKSMFEREKAYVESKKSDILNRLTPDINNASINFTKVEPWLIFSFTAELPLMTHILLDPLDVSETIKLIKSMLGE